MGEFWDHLKEPIDKDFLKFVLTKKELKPSQWLQDLHLGSCESPIEEYERLLAIIIGSAYVGFKTQVFDYQKEIGKVAERVVGAGRGVNILCDALPDNIDGKDLRK